MGAYPVTALRAAREADAEAIAVIYNQGIAERQATFETEPRVAADVREWLAAGDALLVAEQGEAVVGWARAHPYSARPAYRGVRECSIFVDRAARGRGAGAELLEALAAECERRGDWKLVGRLFASNRPSIALMRGCGFRDVGVHRRHGRLEGQWRDVLLVERLLGEALDES